MGSSKSKATYIDDPKHVVISQTDIDECKRFYKTLDSDYGNAIELRKYKGLIKCDVCKVEFDSGIECLRHDPYCRVLHVHSYWEKNIKQLAKLPHKCPICKNRFGNKYGFKTHIFSCMSTEHNPDLELNNIDEEEWDTYRKKEVKRLGQLICNPDIDGKKWTKCQTRGIKRIQQLRDVGYRRNNWEEMIICSIARENWDVIRELHMYGLEEKEQDDFHTQIDLFSLEEKEHVDLHVDIPDSSRIDKIVVLSTDIVEPSCPDENVDVPDQMTHQAKADLDSRHAVIDDPDRILCSVCLDKPYNTVLVPCCHACVCVGCSKHLEICPLCRAVIKSTMKIFLK